MLWVCGRRFGKVEFEAVVVDLYVYLDFDSYVHRRTTGARTSVRSYAISSPSILGVRPVVAGGAMVVVTRSAVSVARFTPRFALAGKTAVRPPDKAMESFSGPRACVMASRSER